MMNFLVGIVVGIVISTVGLVAIAEKIDNSVEVLKKSIESTNEKI